MRNPDGCKEANGEIKDDNLIKKEAPLVPTEEIGNGSRYENFSDKVGFHQNQLNLTNQVFLMLLA